MKTFSLSSKKKWLDCKYSTWHILNSLWELWGAFDFIMLMFATCIIADTVWIFLLGINIIFSVTHFFFLLAPKVKVWVFSLGVFSSVSAMEINWYQGKWISSPVSLSYNDLDFSLAQKLFAWKSSKLNWYASWKFTWKAA